MSVFFVLLLALAVTLKLNKVLEETISFSIVLQSFSLYLSGAIFGSLLPGLYLDLFLYFAAIVVIVNCFIKDRHNAINCIKSSGFLIWIFVVAFFALMSIGRGVYDYDDVIVWALNVKNMVFFDSLYPQGSSIVSVYPPATMLWNYLACKTWIHFSDGIVLWAYCTYAFALFFPIAKRVKTKKVIAIALAIICVVLPMAAEGDVYMTLHSDILIAGLLFNGLYVIYRFWTTNEKYYLVHLSLIINALVHTKRMGIVCAVAILMALAITLERNKSKFLSYSIISFLTGIFYVSFWKFDYKALIILIGYLLGIVLMYYKLLLEICKKYLGLTIVVGITAFYFAYKAYNNAFKDVYFLKEKEQLFFATLLSGKVCFEGTLLQLSLVGFLLLTAITLIILKWIIKVDEEDRTRYDVMFRIYSAFLIGMLIYIVALFHLYMDEIAYNGEELLSFDRYILPIYLTVTFWMIFMARELYFKDDIGKYLVLLALVLIVANNGSVVAYVTKPTEKIAFSNFDVELEELYSKKESICYINCRRDIEDFNVRFHYYVAPVQTNLNTITGINGYDKDRKEPSVKELANSIKEGGYSYVYLDEMTDRFGLLYGSLFEDKCEVGTSALYRVEVSGNDIFLSEVK